MKKSTKLLLFIVVAAVFLITAVVSYICLALPDTGKPEDIKIALSPQRIARGKYLANHVILCMDCHSQRDWSKPIGAIAAVKLGAGGDDFDSSIGVPGDIYVPNITPYKLKNWTDGEILRAITTGERKDGSAIYPLMPWPYFSKLDREDLYSIIAYLRTLPPIKTSLYPKPKLDFPANIWAHTLPVKAALGHLPSVGDTVKYGEYLTAVAGCNLCHSQKKNGKMLGEEVPGLNFAGGIEFPAGDKKIYSANLTPDKTTGIGNWNGEIFVKVFKSHAVSSTVALSPMPWYDYSGMTETDLKAIYAYLRSLKPVKSKVMNN